MEEEDDDSMPSALGHHADSGHRNQASSSSRSKYSQSLKTLIPFRFFSSQSHPVDDAGLLSFGSFSWLLPFLWAMFSNKRDISSLQLSPFDVADISAKRLRTLWEQEVAKVGLEKASLLRVILRFLRTRVVLSVCAGTLGILAAFLGPAFLVNVILQWIEKKEAISFYHGFGLCLALLCSEACRCFFHGLMYAVAIRSAVRMKGAFSKLAFTKIISLRMPNDLVFGEMINLVTTDSNTMYDAVVNGLYLLVCPTLFLMCLIYACYILGYTALTGIAIYLIAMLAEFLLVRSISISRGKSMALSDNRVRMMNEILTSIKLIKMYAWEDYFEKKITGIRKMELKELQKDSFLQRVSVCLGGLIPTSATILMFVVHSLLGFKLSISEAFTIIVIFNSLRVILVLLSVEVKLVADSLVSIARLRELLLIQNPAPYVVQQKDGESAIVMENTTLSWTKPQRQPDFPHSARAEALPTLRNISFTLPKGNLLGVCGNIGSGKTSLISSILEQMYLQQGSITANGTFAYASQQAWIFHGTVRENILMGQPFDQDKYDRVVDACCLITDLDILPYGDQTEIGERGLNLSGGQKQRISLARAVYSNRDIFLLDDPLSAVDAHVGKHIFEECIKKALKGKSIILVTHQLQYLEFCDSILVMVDGQIEEAGNHKDLMNADGHYAQLIRNCQMEQCTNEKKKGSMQDAAQMMDWELKNHKGIDNPAFDMSDDEDEQEGTTNHTASSKPEEQLVDREHSGKGAVSWRTYHQFCFVSTGYFYIFFTALTYILLAGSTVFTNWWLSYWLSKGHGVANVTHEEVGNITLNPDLHFYQMIYGVMLIIIMVLSITKSILFTVTTLRVASKLHNSLFKKIIGSPMSFFDTTPTGRIINRFSKDQDEVDRVLNIYMDPLCQYGLMAFFSILTVIAVFPPFLAVYAVLCAILVPAIRMAKRSLRRLKRMESISRSPCISLTTSTLQGHSTIHAYNTRESHIKQFTYLNDTHSNHLFLFTCSSRWLSICLENLVIMSGFGLCLFLVFVPDSVIHSATKGLALSCAIQLTGMFQYVIYTSSEVEARFNSVERQLEYIQNSKSEAPSKIKEVQISENWPQQGNITFVNYKMRYRMNMPIVLNNLNINIRAGEKLGIVGRTGSGKSSLGVALFRLVEPASGTILIDGVDITAIGLQELRSKLSIIPQDPVLFFGTVRYNLDPFDNYSDEDLWAVLEKTYLKDTISKLNKQLQAEVLVNGENFSVGERQLICMARALLRNSKIIVMDEVTASIDAETDSLIQKTVVEAFKDCTVLTIAHRIQTILHTDRILVMDKGEAAEFESPDVLRQRPDSLFSSLLAASNTIST
ncbi:ATP-binding cassette sub-family C member 12 [Genypterus blacodes]|uniref:ATP-binding cassette sub-family C member 12 n=1 Tax=Genypterus blacodes TaxID=154954 RepID=UPI003F760862